MKTAVKIALVFFSLLVFKNGFAQKQGLAAIDSIKKDLAAYKKTDSNKVRLIYRITDGYVQINPDSARAYAQKGLAMAKQLGWQKGIAPFYNVYGMLYSDNSQYELSLKNYKEALAIFERLSNKRNMSSTLNNIGTLYERRGDYVKSQEYNFKSLKLAEAIGDTKLVALLTGNIGNIYNTQENYKLSLSYYLKALKSYTKLNDLQGLAEVNDKIGSDYLQQHKLNEAMIYYQCALGHYRMRDNKIGEAEVLSHIGVLFDEDLDKKLGYLLMAQQIFDSTQPLYTSSITNIGNIGGTYADIFVNKKLKPNAAYKNIPANYYAISKIAETYLKRAIKYSKDAGDVNNLSYYSDNIAQLQEAKGDYKSAFYNYKQSRGIDDSLYSQESKNKIAELTAKYTFQKKEDLYKQQQQISELKMRQIFLYAVLAVVIISGILIFLLNRSRIGQLRLKSELQQKEAEEKTRELLHRNKISESELKAIRAQMNPHFIFNVLNSIESYILENDPKMACRLVQKFASLSRIILENSTQSLVTAEREWKALQLYTELEAIRFNNQFSYSFTADPLIDLSALMLPPMLIQPLIENAIHHGLRNSPDENKNVSITLEQNEQEILFTVIDNGVGIDESVKPKTSAIKGKSIGLSAIRERIGIINVMNADKSDQAAAFEIAPKTGGQGKGTVAKLKLPKIFRNS